MGTTSLIVELVIIGFQTVVWLSFLLLSIWGVDWIDYSTFRDWSGVIAIVLIAVSYSLGTMFDGLAGAFFNSWSYTTAQKVSETIGRLEPKEGEVFRQESPAKMRAYIVATNSSLHDNLEKMFNQNKLLRATSINLLLISLSVILFISTRIGFTWQLIITVLLLILLSVMSIWVWFRSYRTFYYELGMMYIALKKKEKEK